MMRDGKEIRLEKLDALLDQLLTILHQEGTEDTRYAQRTLAMMRRNIALAEGQPSPELLTFLRQDFAGLFPPKASLSEFYREHEDVMERRRRNEEWKALVGEIGEMLG